MAGIAVPIITSLLPFLLQKLFSGQKDEGQQQGGSTGSFFGGQPGRFEQLPTGTPGQKGLLDQLIQGLSGGGTGGGPLGAGLGNLQQILSGDPEAFKAFEAPARRQFEEQTIPALAERLGGGLGSKRSSAFGQQLGASAAGLEESLSAQRAGLQSEALQRLMGFFQQAQQPQFQTQQIPGQPGFGQGIGGSLAQIGGELGTKFVGSGLENLFKGLKFFGGPRSTLESQGGTRTQIG